jgi:transcriptional regulator with XRE-family HTH domain
MPRGAPDAAANNGNVSLDAHHRRMPPREGTVVRARLQARNAVDDLLREVKVGRLEHSLAQKDVARAVGISRSRYSRIEAGDAPGLTIVQASTLLAAVGRRLYIRAYPAGDAIRDAAQIALLGRLHACVHRSLEWRTEVPLPLRGDLRAWDATIGRVDWVIGVEAETRIRDFQAVRRRIALKQRDGQIEHVVLLLANTRRHRELVRDYQDDLGDSFPLPGPRALELLRAGANPGASSIVLL